MKTLLALLLLIPSLSWGEQLKPMGKLFKELLEEGIEIDENTAEYFIYRCSGLFLAIAKGFKKTEKETSNIYKNHALRLTTILSNKHFKLSEDKQESAEFVKDRVVKIMDAYMEDMEDNWVKQGSYLGDSYIEDELKECQDLTVMLLKKNSENE